MSSKEQSNKIITIIKSWENRLEWDDYFMTIAFLSSSRSPCERLHVGCVIVKNKRIISTGYNGFLPELSHTSYVRDNHEQGTIHAEQNSVSDCAKRGVTMNQATAYITHFPCINCFKILAGSGISHIVYANDYKNDEFVYQLAKEANIPITQYVINDNDN
jgi:dCMP deaminase